MFTEKFTKIVEERLNMCRKLLIEKGAEYSNSNDRFRAFKLAATARNTDPIDALDGMWVKHRVSIQEEVRKMTQNPTYMPSQRWIDEKLTDNINYTLLLEGLISERRAEEEPYENIDI